jgi:hypothetical protein
MDTKGWLESLKERGHFKDQGVGGKMMLVWISGCRSMGHEDMDWI